jgi:AraC-like DNA-binding protein
MPPMRYAEYQPSPRLARLVERFWFLEGAATGAADAIIPDGRIELIFHYSGAFWRHTDAGLSLRQPEALLVGQMTGPVILTPEGQAGVAAIRLRSAAARTLLGFSLRDVAGQFVDLAGILPSTAALGQRLSEAADDRTRVAALEQWLADNACPSPRADVEAAVQAILDSSGRTSIDALAAYTGLGVRRLERQFQDDVGLTPKTFARIVRLQAALRLVRAGRPLSDVALESGYYDQAHMTRDFRQLAAISPAAWQNHAGDLAPLFVG